jgi:hypothetical protein
MNDFGVSSALADLRNVEWELYLLYQSGDADVFVSDVARLWCEVDRLEAVVALDGFGL